jgi:hypothetical protein
VVKGAGHKAKRMVVPCINGVSSNPVEGRTKHCQLKDLIITLFGLIFRRIYIFSENGSYVLRGFKTIDYIENNTWQNPYHMPYHPEKPISSRGPLGPLDDIGRG